MNRRWMGLSILVAGVAVAASPSGFTFQAGERWTVQFAQQKTIDFTLEQVTGQPGRSTAMARVIKRQNSELLISTAYSDNEIGTPKLVVSVIELFQDGTRQAPRHYCIVNGFTGINRTPTRIQGDWYTLAASADGLMKQGRCVIQKVR